MDMQTGKLLATVLVSIALGGAAVVAGQLATREPQSGWVVAVGGESFVVLDEAGSPEEVCTVDVGETFCHPVRHRSDLGRQPVHRWRASPNDAPDLALVPAGV